MHTLFSYPCSANTDSPSNQAKMSAAVSYASYDALTKIYKQQTQDEFAASLTADIERALAAGVLDKPQPVKTLREIQAEEAAAATVHAADAAVKKAAEKRIADEKAAALAAWEADRAGQDAAGRKPCWVCLRYAKETHYHAPKLGSCALTEELFYVHDRWGQPHTAYMRRDVAESMRERKMREESAAAAKAAEEAKKNELGNMIDAALTAASPRPKGGKKAKKATVEKFSLDEI